MTSKEMNIKIMAIPGMKKKVAFHEAAHLITLIAYSKHFEEYPHVEKISIAAEESENLGYVRHRPFFIEELLDSTLPIRMRSYYERKGRFAVRQVLAGPASDYILSDEFENGAWEFFESFWLEESGDWEKAISFYRVIFNDSQLDDFELFKSLFSLFEEAVEDVQKYWSYIEEVAEKVEDSLVISGEELQNLADTIHEKI